MQLDMGTSIRRYVPPMGTAGLARDLVRGKSREPAPPPRMMAVCVYVYVCMCVYVCVYVCVCVNVYVCV
jgi:hypothetical protein